MLLHLRSTVFGLIYDSHATECILLLESRANGYLRNPQPDSPARVYERREFWMSHSAYGWDGGGNGAFEGQLLWFWGGFVVLAFLQLWNWIVLQAQTSGVAAASRNVRIHGYPAPSAGRGAGKARVRAR